VENAPGSAKDVLLMPRDRIAVFDLESSRERIIRPLGNELPGGDDYRQGRSGLRFRLARAGHTSRTEPCGIGI
jgi:hypothetical protein